MMTNVELGNWILEQAKDDDDIVITGNFQKEIADRLISPANYNIKDVNCSCGPVEEDYKGEI